jgi:hypothetical protein
MTIGELERRAGIGADLDARAAFWKDFAHLDGRAMIDEGCKELRRRIAGIDPSASTRTAQSLTGRSRMTCHAPSP